MKTDYQKNRIEKAGYKLIWVINSGYLCTKSFQTYRGKSINSIYNQIF